MSDDALHGKILAGVRSKIAVQPEIWGYGPVSDVKPNPRKANCVVLIDENAVVNLPARVDITVDGQLWKIDINKRNRKKYKIRFQGPEFSRREVVKGALTAGAVAISGLSPAESADMSAARPLPEPLTGTLMGGDAIFNSKYRDAVTSPDDVYWGTVAYVSGAGGKISVPSDPVVLENVPRSCVSCGHVLTHDQGGSIQTAKHSSGFSTPVTLPGWPSGWPSSMPSGSTWPDLAASAAASSVSVSEKEVRGLGMLQGVEAPAVGDIVAKYGATTGLTVARDNGVVWRRLPDETGSFYMIRSLAMQFSAPGDSGAAVVYAGVGNPKHGKLAGFVLAGSTADDEQFYLPARPLSPAAPVPPELTIAQIDL